MTGRIFNLDWEKFNYKDEEQRRQLAGALQYFCALPNKYVAPEFAKDQEFLKAHKQLQEFTTYSDGWFNEKAIDVVARIHAQQPYDNGYEQIFAINDFTGTKASGFDVGVVNSGLTFNEVKVGEKLKVYQAEGAKYRCYFCYYGGALGWHRQLFEDGDWWTIEDNAIDFRNRAYGGRAGVFYALLEAAADQIGCCSTVDSGCSDCSADARQIMDSINYAATDIIVANQHVDPTIGLQTQLIILCPIQLYGRVRQALGLQTQSYVGSTKIASYNYQLIVSPMLTNANRVMVILPKGLIRGGYRMDLTLFSDFDILSYTDTVAGWMRYGACIGNLQQIACIEFDEISGSCPSTHINPIAACGDVVDDNGDVIDWEHSSGFTG